MAFWSAIIKPGSKPVPYVPPPEAFNLHLSQATLPATVKEGTRVSVLLKREADDEGVVICTLKAGTQDSIPLDLFLDHYAEFTLVGSSANVAGSVEVHLTGYYSPPEIGGLPDGEDSEDDEDYVGEEGMDLDHPAAAMMLHGHDEDDEDDEGEDEEDEGEDEEDEDEEDDLLAPRKPHVIIEEIHDSDEEGGKKAAAGSKAGKKGAEPIVHEPTPPPQDKKAAGTKRAAEEPAASKQEQPASKKPAAGDKKEAKQEQQQAAQKTPSQQQKQQKQQGKAQAGSPAEQNGSAAREVKTGKKNVRTWENGLMIEDVAMGPPNGKVAKAGKRVTMKYVGKLKSNGKVFDKNNKFNFRLGVGEVIKGWDIGVEGMRVGDKRRLVIPPQLAYGSSGVKGAIPPSATLEFEVELVDVK